MEMAMPLQLANLVQFHQPHRCWQLGHKVIVRALIERLAW
jgi:hypothetical protein